MDFQDLLNDMEGMSNEDKNELLNALKFNLMCEGMSETTGNAQQQFFVTMKITKAMAELAMDKEARDAFNSMCENIMEDLSEMMFIEQ